MHDVPAGFLAHFPNKDDARHREQSAGIIDGIDNGGIDRAAAPRHWLRQVHQFQPQPFALHAVIGQHPADNRDLADAVRRTANRDIENLDTLETTSVTARTPVHGPVYDRRGRLIGRKTVSYTSATVKSTLVTPKTQLYSTTGASSAFGTPIVDFRCLATPSVQFTPFVSLLQKAYFSLNTVSTSAPTAVIGGLVNTYLQAFGAGTISFTRTAPVQLHTGNGRPNGPARSNLLTVCFQSATLLAQLGTGSLTFMANSPGDPLVYTSDFPNLGNATDYDFSLTLSAPSPSVTFASITPALTNLTGRRSFNTARTFVTGGFSASSVREPGQWALLIAGFGLVGVSLRRRAAASAAR